MVTQFGLLSVDLLELFSTLGNYFQWFHIDAAPLQVTDMENLLSADTYVVGLTVLDVEYDYVVKHLMR